MTPQDGDRWMLNREADMSKIWLENLSEAEYEAYKAAQRHEKEQHQRRLKDRPEGF